ncbi:hypothetical protein Q3G72_009410 [Acer saccharum]|nr:hypothetical protein Q3G72_009410 [Acer saccharum]
MLPSRRVYSDTRDARSRHSCYLKRVLTSTKSSSGSQNGVWRLRLLGFVCLIALGPSFGCAHVDKGPRPATDTVEGLYQRGVDELESGLYSEPLATLGDVKTQYPYSRFAALAELRMADTHMRHQHHIEAIDGYRNFLKFHPTHAEAPYALSRIGEAYFAQIPSDWWFLPPSAEKEQDNIRQAIASYQDMLARYDAGDLTEVVRKHLSDCRRKLADHELYVARFYHQRDKHLAAALRAEGLLSEFDGLGLDAQALWIAAESRIALGDTSAAKGHLERLVAQFSQSPEGQQAANRIKSLHSAKKS